MSVRGYTVGANWSRGPDYSGALEDLSSFIDKDENVVASWGRAEAATSTDAAAGQLNYSLINRGRQFSPENMSSPIAGAQTVGTPTRLLYDGVMVFSGVIDDITITSDRTGGTADIQALDGMPQTTAVSLSTPVLQGQRTGDLIGYILDQVGWPVSARALDPGATVVPFWWAEGTSAEQAIADLVHSEGEPSIAFIRNGVFTFYDRHHRLLRAASLTSQGVHTHIVPSGPIGTDHKIVKDTFTYDHGLKRIANSASLTVEPPRPTTEVVVWETEDPIALGSNEQVTYFISTDRPFVNLQTPSATYAYLTDEGTTYDYTLTTGSVTFALSRTSGQSAIVTMTAGLGGAQINTGLRVRGTPMEVGAARKFVAADVTSQGRYGINEWGGQAPWAGYYDAQALVDQAVATYSQPQPTVTFDIESRFADTTRARILAANISDRITVRNDVLGLNTDFHIERLTHIVQGLGVRHTLTVAGQVATASQASNAFRFDTAGAGFGQGQFTALAGNNPSTMFLFDVAGRGFDQGVFAL